MVRLTQSNFSSHSMKPRKGLSGPSGQCGHCWGWGGGSVGKVLATKVRTRGKPDTVIPAALWWENGSPEKARKVTDQPPAVLAHTVRTPCPKEGRK